eukprot:TRINITY_DN1248_c0_g3_i1.p1 TRINITY_DN1248_c0_g3~~TRINITY_DN1248_c0_g3_i1.p1  ORF type:complete len:1153 (+),score=332.37 TRINITY_DN1248_c0_g3_i1:63-3521(+)
MPVCDIEDTNKNRFQRISRPISEIKDHYEVVVIGSGYGGGISASRLSRGGKKVCLLERGKEILPGDYPSKLVDATEQLQFDSNKMKWGNRTGLYNLHIGEDQAVMVGCGLGGTSLINANVALEATPDVFQNDNWPEKFRNESSERLQKGYDRAREMLKPNVYPDSYPPLAKYDAHQKSARYMHQEHNFKKTPINVTFKTPDSGVNHVGVPQVACNNCGDCCSGCNVGAKNTTLMNYLPDAFNHGADIFCEVHVEYIEKTPEGKWLVHYTLAHTGSEKFDAPTITVSADIVVVSAGTMGSNEIMLRSREKGLSMSSMLGRHFSGNGDILGFGYNCEDKINGIGYGDHDPKGLEPCGPCITSVIDMRVPGGDNMVLEEGNMPGPIGKIMAPTMALANKVWGKNTVGGLNDITQKWIRQNLSKPPFQGAMNHTQTYLVMSHDDARGVLSMHNNRMQINYPDVGKQANFQTGNDNMQKATEALKGNYVKNPMWSKMFGKDVISVHPLGGCCMASNATNGVVDHKGRVYSETSGESVHDGLYISDGSIIPTSLAVNPLLTISAVTERNMELLAEDYGFTIDYTLPSAVRRPHDVPKLGVEFTETMKGKLAVPTSNKNTIEEFEEAERRGTNSIQFTLTIRGEDLDRMLNSPAHRASMIGTVQCSVLDPAPLTVVGGDFQLFVEVPSPPNTKHMVYSMTMYSKSGKPYYFHGYKVVKDIPNPLRIWHDTSTLYVNIYAGTTADSEVIYKGVMHIEMFDFMKQMTTMKVLNAKNNVERLNALARFGVHFAGVLWESYGGVLVKPQLYDPNAPPRVKRPLAVCKPEFHYFSTDDQVTLRLTRYQGGTKGPVMLVHGLGVSSKIFSTDLIDVNMLEYLYKNDFDVWLLDFRVSILLPASDKQSNGDQVAQYDYPAAVKKIKHVTGADSIQAVVHCWGSTTFFMSMLAGLQGIRSIVCSQISTEVVTTYVTLLKSMLRLPKLFETVGIDSMTTYVDTTEGIVGRVIDKGLSVYSLVEAQGQCNSSVCHRVTFNYASLYKHDQLNQRLHENLHELFAEANITAFQHLAMVVRKGHLVNCDGKEVYMQNMANLDLPILFISGAENECFLPEATKRTYENLCTAYGPDNYSRKVIEGYGHIDCIFGRNAHVDVFPHILEHLNKTA